MVCRKKVGSHREVVPAWFYRVETQKTKKPGKTHCFLALSKKRGIRSVLSTADVEDRVFCGVFVNFESGNGLL